MIKPRDFFPVDVYLCRANMAARFLLLCFHRWCLVELFSLKHKQALKTASGSY